MDGWKKFLARKFSGVVAVYMLQFRGVNYTSVTEHFQCADEGIILITYEYLTIH